MSAAGYGHEETFTVCAANDWSIRLADVRENQATSWNRHTSAVQPITANGRFRQIEA